MKTRNRGYLLCIPFISIVILLSWFLAVILEHFSGHHKIFNSNNLSNNFAPKNSGPPYPSDRNENILLFIQISDLHISKFRYVDEIIPQLEDLCETFIPIIQPQVVLITGDLTDAKAIDKRKSQQYLEEWITYEKLVKKCRQKFPATWLDLKGNHDSFGVPSEKHSLNLYKKFGSAHELYGTSKSYQYVLKTKFGKYAFNGIDMTPDPGPKRPFNFFGIVEQNDLEVIKNMNRNSNLNNMTVWFGHYPISTITTPSQVRQILQDGIAYLCGHLHTIGGLIPAMYARPRQGHLELELGDWKESRRYRIIAIDHDIFSFTDVTFGELPIILITNPKDARFQAPAREALYRVKYSSHIRFLVFNKSKIKVAKVLINKRLLCENARNVGGSLYVCPWQPNQFKSGINQMQISVEDVDGHKVSKEMQFSLDGSIPLLELLPAIIMLTDFCIVAKLLYFLSFTIFVISPLFLRYVELKTTQSRRWNILLFPIIIHKIHVFSKNDKLFWPLFYFSVYLSIGPLFIGEIVPGSIGVCFVHGIYSNNHWLPGSLTYLYAAINIVVFNFPLMVYLGEISSANKHASNITATTICNKLFSNLIHTLFVFVLLMQIYFARIILTCYGLMSFVLSPVATWNFFLGIWLRYQIK